MECNDEKFSGIVARSKTIIFIVHGGHGDSQLEINNSRTKTFPTNFVLASGDCCFTNINIICASKSE